MLSSLRKVIFSRSAPESAPESAPATDAGAGAHDGDGHEQPAECAPRDDDEGDGSLRASKRHRADRLSTSALKSAQNAAYVVYTLAAKGTEESEWYMNQMHFFADVQAKSKAGMLLPHEAASAREEIQATLDATEEWLATLDRKQAFKLVLEQPQVCARERRRTVSAARCWLTRHVRAQAHAAQLEALRADAAEAAARADAAAGRAAEAEKALRVQSIERHQAADGHAELGSAFPLVRRSCQLCRACVAADAAARQPREIAAKVSSFASSELNALLIDHLLPLVTLSEAADLLSRFFTRLSHHKDAVFHASGDSIFAALGGNDSRSEVSNSTVKRLFQERWEMILHLRDGTPPAVSTILRECGKEVPDMCACHALLGRVCTHLTHLRAARSWVTLSTDEALCARILPSVDAAALRIAALATLNDQSLRLDWASLGRTVPYSKDAHALLDDTCKPGAPCVVLFPALRAGDAVHAKAAVLPAGYSLI